MAAKVEQTIRTVPFIEGEVDEDSSTHSHLIITREVSVVTA
jgi:hypothetical protein